MLTIHKYDRFSLVLLMVACASAGTRLSAVVGFLLQLGGQGVGSPLPLRAMDDLQVSIAADLAQLGLILPFK